MTGPFEGNLAQCPCGEWGTPVSFLGNQYGCVDGEVMIAEQISPLRDDLRSTEPPMSGEYWRDYGPTP